MKKSNLNQFINLKIETLTQSKIKGGLRFLTYNESEYNYYRFKLDYYGISYNHAVTKNDKGQNHYCIEW